MFTHRGLSGPAVLQISSYWREGWPIRINLAPDIDLRDKALTLLAERLSRWELVPSGSEGYRKAEVTAGGIDTRDLSSQTLESKQPGLFFIGEVVDVTGWLGGYNFQWAWASGHACALALAAQAAATPA
ncbi:MAG: hypothetical protein NVS3B2_18760 [Ramlibacter sp.]